MVEWTFEVHYDPCTGRFHGIYRGDRGFAYACDFDDYQDAAGELCELVIGGCVDDAFRHRKPTFSNARRGCTVACVPCNEDGYNLDAPVFDTDWPINLDPVNAFIAEYERLFDDWNSQF